ncbi:hypothetical protein ACHQM5_017648 [Ranunculus cassubicifolius]
MEKALVILLTLAMAMSVLSSPSVVDVHRVREIAGRYNITCVLVFGDSSVDPGNNNHLSTTFKGNFLPYGMNFFKGHPTGRFSNGKLPTDFVAEAIGFTKVIPAYFDPTLNDANLLHGVSFASAASGYDDFTANLTNVLPVSKQLEYLMHYKLRLERLVGIKRATEIIKNAVFVMSMGTNDFLQNYFLEPLRASEYTVEKYGDFLVESMLRDIKKMHRIGGTRLIVVGVPPLGCMPLVKTLVGSTSCSPKFNDAALSFNNKAKAMLATTKRLIGVSSLFIDAYSIVKDAVDNPIKYGFTESSKGCVGTGTLEYGDTCKGMPTCKDPSKYVFWDAVHPTQDMYKLVADDILNSLNPHFLD